MENIGTYTIGIKNEWMEDVGWKPPETLVLFLGTWNQPVCNGNESSNPQLMAGSISIYWRVGCKKSYDERMKGYEWLWVKTLVPAGTLSHGWDL
jgi:hypothetical protein